MNNSPKKKGRPVKSTVAPGIWLRRGKTYWLRYSVGGEQIRVSLETGDPKEAIKRADELRGRKVETKQGRVRGGKTPLDRDLEKYTAGKLASGDFGQSAASGAKQAIKHFSKSMGIERVEEITTAKIEAYYKKTKTDQSEATAQTYSTRVCTFARAQGLRVTSPKFSSETPSRTITISTGKVAELLRAADGNTELQFILLAGFRAGMRRNEISMARPAWFDLENGVINIPAKDLVTGFQPKSKRARTIPLVKEFRAFIQENFPDWGSQPFCIRPEKKMGAWIYRFDFRKLFSNFAKKQNCPQLTPHVMRHSYASHLANGGVGIAQLASWVGDRIATLEKHYLHLQADAAKAEAAFISPGQIESEESVREAEFADASFSRWIKKAGFSGEMLEKIQAGEL